LVYGHYLIIFFFEERHLLVADDVQDGGETRAMSNYQMNCLRILVMVSGLAGLGAMSAQPITSPPQAPQSTLSGALPEPPIQDTALLPSRPLSPQGRITLLGGTIDTIDRVRDEFTLRTFGSGHMRILFDERTRVYLDGMTAGRHSDLHHGQRVHLDAVLDDTKVFAQSIYVLAQAPTIECDAQVESYKATTGDLVIRDSSLGAVIKVQLLPSTVVRRNDRLISRAEIHPKSLISIAFQPETGGRAIALKVSVLAEPGDTVTFRGRVMHLDMRARLVVLEDPHDQKTYEIYFAPSHIQVTDGLHEGTNVTIATTFDGTRYVGATLIIDP
jgi:hypothetical protein